MSSDCPSASACVKPNIRSAARFQKMMAPFASRDDDGIADWRRTSAFISTPLLIGLLPLVSKDCDDAGAPEGTPPSPMTPAVSDRLGFVQVRRFSPGCSPARSSTSSVCSPSSGEPVISGFRSENLIGLPTVRYLPRSLWSTSTIGAARAQRRVVGDLLHRQHRRAGDVELAQDVDRLELGLVGEPLLDRREDLEDVRLARLRRSCRPGRRSTPACRCASQIGAQAWPWIVK